MKMIKRHRSGTERDFCNGKPITIFTMTPIGFNRKAARKMNSAIWRMLGHSEYIGELTFFMSELKEPIEFNYSGDREPM